MKLTSSPWKRLIPLTLVAIWQCLPGVLGADLAYPPTSSGGHDFNHAPIGQTFLAPAANVHGGLWLADGNSFTDALALQFPGQIQAGSYPYPVTASITIQADLLDGAGVGGAVLHSTRLDIAAPFNGFVDIDYTAAGVSLTPGQPYTLLYTDLSSGGYPQGVTGWIVPSVTDTTAGTGSPMYDSNGNVIGFLPVGSYADGFPILQGSLVTTDAGIGDNAFQILESPAPQVDVVVSGTNAVITAYVARNPGFIVVNGGMNLLDHLWTSNLNPGNTTFLGGLINWFQTGLLVDYTGIATSQGVLLTQLTVKPASAPLVISTQSLPTATFGIAYQASVDVTGGVAPVRVDLTGLPAGLTQNAGVIQGTPTTVGTFPIGVSVTDGLGRTAVSTLQLIVNAPPANYTLRDEGKARIIATTPTSITVGTKRILWHSGTSITVKIGTQEFHTIPTTLVVGKRIEWKGLRDAVTGDVMASKLEIQ